MKNINHTIISGNISVIEPLKATATGGNVLKFCVAVNEPQKQGETWGEHTNFIPVAVFGREAQFLSEHLSKGYKVAVEGKLHWSQWTDKATGQNRSKIEVIASHVEWSEPRGKDAPAFQVGGPGTLC